MIKTIGVCTCIGTKLAILLMIGRVYEGMIRGVVSVTGTVRVREGGGRVLVEGEIDAIDGETWLRLD